MVYVLQSAEINKGSELKWEKKMLPVVLISQLIVLKRAALLAQSLNVRRRSENEQICFWND